MNFRSYSKSMENTEKSTENALGKPQASSFGRQNSFKYRIGYKNNDHDGH